MLLLIRSEKIVLHWDRMPGSISDGRWRLARDADGRERLYDRRVDPEENVDLAGIETGARERLAAELREHRSRAPLAGAAASGLRIDPELARRLRALGYAAPEGL